MIEEVKHKLRLQGNIVMFSIPFKLWPYRESPMLKDLVLVCDPENVAMEPVEHLSDSHERWQDLSKGSGWVVLIYEFCDRM